MVVVVVEMAVVGRGRVDGYGHGLSGHGLSNLGNLLNDKAAGLNGSHDDDTPLVLLHY